MNTDRWIIVDGLARLIAHWPTKDAAYAYMRAHPTEASRGAWLVHELIDPELISIYY